LAGRAAASMAAGHSPTEAAAEYTAAIDATLGAEMRAGRECLKAYANRAILFHLVLAWSAPGWAVFQRVAAGTTTFPRLLSYRAVRFALRAAQR
jgi:hypothetical protein